MRILCVFGQHNYGDPLRGEGYEYSNFLPTFRRLGHEVIFFESKYRDAYPDFAALNEALLRAVERYRPDVLFAVIFTFEIWLETWQLVRESGLTATVNWATDDSWKYVQSSRFIAPYLHAFTTTYPDIYERYKRDGIDHVLLTQWAANAEYLRPPLPAAECIYPVSFVGTAHGSRKEWVEQLREQGIEVACFGYGWPHGPVAAEEIPHILRRSVISLNFSNAGKEGDGLITGSRNQIKARTFEVPGAGGFLLTQAAAGLENFYLPGQEIAVFNDNVELAQKIRHFLANPRERDEIALAGFTRTKADHTYDQRLTEVLEYVLREKRKYESNHDQLFNHLIDWHEFDRAVARHKTKPLHEYLTKLLVRMATTIWGPFRGPRAARALVFQASYRINGRHTYSAAGWPGRLFYKQS